MTIVRVMSFNVFSPGELEEEGDEYSPEELLNGVWVSDDRKAVSVTYDDVLAALHGNQPATVRPHLFVHEHILSHESDSQGGG